MTPEKLGRYEILGELGKGAMGVVYLAQDPIIRRQLAIKTFRMAYTAKEKEVEQFKERFLREAQAIGQLSHPNIVTVHDVGQEEDEYFIAMEYVKGVNLKQRMQAEDGPMPLDFAVDVTAQIAEGLACAHDKGIVHRDIKPANIIITQKAVASPHGTLLVKITDFGIARIEQSNLTVAGQLLGTPNYMAPEQIKGETVDARTDIFSLGVLLYEMLTRKKPFAGENLTQVSHRIVYDDHTSPAEYVAALPPELLQVLDHALEKAPSARYQDASEMARDLRAMQEPVEPLSGEIPVVAPGSPESGSPVPGAKSSPEAFPDTPSVIPPSPPTPAPAALAPPDPPVPEISVAAPTAKPPPADSHVRGGNVAAAEPLSSAPPLSSAIPASTDPPLPPEPSGAPPPGPDSTEPSAAELSASSSASSLPVETSIEDSAGSILTGDLPATAGGLPPPPPVAVPAPSPQKAPRRMTPPSPRRTTPPSRQRTRPPIPIRLASVLAVLVVAFLAGVFLLRGMMGKSGETAQEALSPAEEYHRQEKDLIERANKLVKDGLSEQALGALIRGVDRLPYSTRLTAHYFHVAEKADSEQNIEHAYVRERMAAVNALTQAQQYESAYDVLEKILFVDPENAEATSRAADIERLLNRRQSRAAIASNSYPPPERPANAPPPPLVAPSVAAPESVQIKIVFRTFIAEGKIKVYADGAPIWQKDFAFDNRKPFKRKYLRSERGFDESHDLMAGTVELQVEAEVDTKDGAMFLEGDLLRVTLEASANPTFSILVAEDGTLKTSWTP